MSQPDEGHPVVLRTNDGVESNLVCSHETSVLDAAAEVGLILPAMCRIGNCGACTATVMSGQYNLGEHSADALGSGEGAVVLCRTFPEAECVIDLPYDRTRIVDTPLTERGASITALDRLTADVVRLEVSLEADEHGGSSAEFEAGQFVQLQVPGWEEWRAYSLANISNWDGSLEFYIRIQPGGLFSTHLDNQAAVGDTLVVRGPQGAFGLREKGLRPRWFLGGGTGIAPLLSMLRRMAEWGDPQPARLYHGVNTVEDVFALSEVADLAGALPDFAATTCVWRAGDGAAWDGFVGTPVDAMLADLGSATEMPDVYICGPPAMVSAMEEGLSGAGVPADHLIVERFSAN